MTQPLEHVSFENPDEVREGEKQRPPRQERDTAAVSRSNTSRASDIIPPVLSINGGSGRY
jgi:hypothetical protein